MKALSWPAIPKASGSLRLRHPESLSSSASLLCFPLLPSNPLYMALTLVDRASDGRRRGHRQNGVPVVARMHSNSASSVANPPRPTSTSAVPARRKLQNGGFSSSPSRSSLYSRPSLRDMQNERAANRARVYEFLRGLGIVPDELDGLELPVTVDVMRERVDFLHSLGLTVADINNYPLVLGCSVKKNMVPVLDYLGKLGVRKSTLTEFLRRYPQVLHASVVVDLAPVVKYLQGMDIRTQDIPRVLEKYPEVLGFKLEGTMSTSVAYLVGIGVARREIGGVLARYPEILGMRVGRVIKPFVEYLESIGLPRRVLARLIEKRPHILGFGLEDQVKPNVDALVEFSVRKEAVASVIAQFPDIIGKELKPKLVGQKSLLESSAFVGAEDFGRVVEKMPQVVSLSRAVILKHVDFLKHCGFSLKQVSKMVISCPQILALNLDVMKMSFDYFQEEMDRDLEDLLAFPAFFTYSLESTIKPRHQLVAKKGLKCSLGWLLNCTDAKFQERMSYDSFGIEEMEPEPTFDMKSLLEPRENDDDDYSNEDSDDDSDYSNEDSDDEYT